jgi:curli production assembly/transport component CsgG
MYNFYRVKYRLLLLACTVTLSGCAPMFRVPVAPEEARLGQFSSVHDDFQQLPGPLEKIIAAVYQFRDQTGQYKITEFGASWSTSVTQGATSILLQSLDESGWFVPIEREGMANLLNERRIIRSSREQYEGGEGALLPPLLFGGIILEGGIISYETNIVTGGAGLRYFGAGASGEYREDKVSVYLRAVSSSNGRILKNVHTSKTILSQKINAGLFRYVSLRRLLEAETGFTYNEPANMAVQEAIDKAVYALIIEGVLDGLWLTEDPAGLDHPSIRSYLEERDMSYKTDHLGFHFDERRRQNLAIGIKASGKIYDGDYEGGVWMPGLDVSLGLFQRRSLSLTVSSGISRAEARNAFGSDYIYSGVDIRYRFLNYYQHTPYIRFGGGLLYSTMRWSANGVPDELEEQLMPFLRLSIGYEWLVGRYTGFSLSLCGRQLLNDNIDGMVHGQFNDRILSVGFGFNFYFL